MSKIRITITGTYEPVSRDYKDADQDPEPTVEQMIAIDESNAKGEPPAFLVDWLDPETIVVNFTEA